MKQLLANLVEWGLPGLFLAALLDGAGVPVPSGVDVLIVFLATRIPGKILMMTALSVLGSVTGNLFLFSLARRGGQMFLEKRTASKRSKRFRQWFDNYGLLTVFVAALVPLPVMPLKIFVFCSGALGVSPARFVAVFIAARIPRYLGLALLGRAMGDDALTFLKLHVWHLAGFAAALFVVLVAMVKYMDRKRGAKTVPTEA
jgi:membrane protein DedA with SNARE-associated domain